MVKRLQRKERHSQIDDYKKPLLFSGLASMFVPLNFSGKIHDGGQYAEESQAANEQGDVFELQDHVEKGVESAKHGAQRERLPLILENTLHIDRDESNCSRAGNEVGRPKVDLLGD